jgi:hypothetical protein
MRPQHSFPKRGCRSNGFARDAALPTRTRNDEGSSANPSLRSTWRRVLLSPESSSAEAARHALFVSQNEACVAQTTADGDGLLAQHAPLCGGGEQCIYVHGLMNAGRRIAGSGS